ncbi:class I SAM-dependent methyltransferase [Vampirovibrio chlorellavorus]|uniref:class I SAM-dependent methyltransferase n=1 Tax=Vampirovibrio chlorellavorus TaxID=758823 RepID=UPI0026F2B149|nr:class I SAM-dependent methyltransferase [Vampirovibrio chlorellavorus]
MPEGHWRQALWNLVDWTDQPRGLGQWLANVCERLGPSEWGAQSWLAESGVPPAFVLSAPPGLRRIVEIGCGTGAFTLAMALLFPQVEIVGIDADARKIEAARAAVGYCDNLRFVQGQAAVMDEIPCDRMVYNRCLSASGDVTRFRKTVFKTSRWLVDEGDFWVKESLPGMLAQPALWQMLASCAGTGKSIEALIAHILTSTGHALEATCVGQGLFGLPCELFSQAFPQNALMAAEVEEPAATESAPVRVVSVSEQTNDTLVGLLFEKTEQDWQKILV